MSQLVNLKEAKIRKIEEAINKYAAYDEKIKKLEKMKEITKKNLEKARELEI